MPTPLALVRPPASSFRRVLSTHPDRQSIDTARALHQHRDYCNALEEAGAEVVELEPLEDFPDSTFIEDNAVILKGTGFITAMREPSRRGESSHLKTTLEKFIPVQSLAPPVFIDGGDVLTTPQSVFIGQSGRTGAEAVSFFKSRLNLPVVPVPVTKALHLKTAVTWLGGDNLILNPQACDPALFQDFECIQVEPEEAYAANCLAIGETVILPAGYKKVEEKIIAMGLKVRPVDMSEFEKADGGVTCLSLILSL